VNNLKNVVCLIPAFKKSSRFQDDLVRRLNQVPLIQRTLNLAVETGFEKSSIFLLTDSDEIMLTGTRFGINAYLGKQVNWDPVSLNGDLGLYLRNQRLGKRTILVLSPYSPFLKKETVLKAISRLVETRCDIVQLVEKAVDRLFLGEEQNLRDAVFDSNREESSFRSSALLVLRPDLLSNDFDYPLVITAMPVGEDAYEIRSLRDWWVCEKLLQRRRIVFRVIGDKTYGMGHIYRALSLAHEMTDHEVLFVTDVKSDVAVRTLAGYEYWTGVYPDDSLVEEVIGLAPDLVVLDILNSSVHEVQALKRQGIGVVSFEDLGAGSQCTDLTINELYDEPQLPGENYLWGRDFFFVRDEFASARPRIFARQVKAVLLAFGGTDQHDLSRKIFRAIKKCCAQFNVHIHIVTGPGYSNYQDLRIETEKDQGVTLTHATGVISEIMEQCDLAISSNGRTVYELAHMNVPGIVIDQHERENTHNFARAENGFIVTGIYRVGATESIVKEQFLRLIRNHATRHALYQNTIKHSFLEAKHRVAQMLEDIAHKQMS
jgi:spore coat polysaccharide biosynthesis predicted glycosyltransferase SpsG